MTRETIWKIGKRLMLIPLLLGIGVVLLESLFWVNAHWMRVEVTATTIYVNFIRDQRTLCYAYDPNELQSVSTASTYPLWIVEPLALKVTTTSVVEYGSANSIQVDIATGKEIPIPVDLTLYAGLPQCDDVEDLFDLAEKMQKG